MRRGEFITSCHALAWPLAARAARQIGMRRIGFLGLERRLEKFRQGLRDLAMSKDAYCYRVSASDPADRLPGFAAELVALNADYCCRGFAGGSCCATSNPNNSNRDDRYQRSSCTDCG